MTTMVGKTRELGTATLGGLVVGSAVSAILALGAPFYPDIFAFFYPVIGIFHWGNGCSLLASWKSSHAVRLGFLSGLLSTHSLWVDDIFAYLLIPIHPSDTALLNYRCLLSLYWE